MHVFLLRFLQCLRFDNYKLLGADTQTLDPATLGLSVPCLVHWIG